MKKIHFFILSTFLTCGSLFASNESDLLQNAEQVYQATKIVCSGISDEIGRIANISTANTAITGIGTAAATGALVAGVKKSSADEDIKKLIDEMCTKGGCDANSITTMSDEDFYEGVIKTFAKIADLQDKMDDSKRLGNWRTGLMATGAATNLAGTIIAAKNKVDADLDTQINSCKESIANLRTSIMQARINGEDVAEAQSIASACGDFELVDISKINRRGKGAMISSGVGPAMGLAGTITSAAANSNTIRSQKTDDGLRTDKEKNLNTASNVLAGASAAASATATVFNATQIKAIKQVAEVASKCTGVLK